MNEETMVKVECVCGKISKFPESLLFSDDKKYCPECSKEISTPTFHKNEEIEELSKSEQFDNNWEMTNHLTFICDEYLSDDNGIFTEDVFTALERVKFHLLSDHVEARIARRIRKTFGVELKPWSDEEFICDDCIAKRDIEMEDE